MIRAMRGLGALCAMGAALGAATARGQEMAPPADDPATIAGRLADSNDPRDRERAARLVAPLGNFQAARLLLRLAGDRHDGVRDEALSGLRLLSHPDARALALASAVGAGDARVRSAAAEAAGAYAASESGTVLAKCARDGSADVREAAARALGEPTPPAGAAADVLAERLGDPAAIVRSAAAESLARVAPALLVEALGKLQVDRDPAVRVAAVLAAAVAGAPEVSRDAATRGLSDRDWRVRSAAAEVLGDSKDLQAVTPLIAGLRRETGRLRRDLSEALRRLTGKDLGADADLWQLWWSAHWGKAGSGAPPERPRDVTRADYYGVPVLSDRIAFVLDLSKSMGDPPAAGQPPRIESARAEIRKTLLALPGTARINVVTFGTRVAALRPSLYPASPDAREATIQWLNRRIPDGGTNIYDGLAMAMADPEVDTIFLLTDGSPSEGTFLNPGDILRVIGRKNRYRRIQIHAIAIGETAKGRALLPKLAELTGGVYVKR